MKIKKLIATVLVTTLTVTSLIGCGNSKETTSKTKGQSNKEASYTLNIGASGDSALNNPLVQ